MTWSGDRDERERGCSTPGGDLPAGTTARRAKSGTAREQTRRRLLLLAIAGLMLLGVVPVYGHHLMQGTWSLLGGGDRFGELCLVALHEVFAPVHDGFHLLIAAGVAYAVWDRARAWWRARRVLHALEISRAARAPEPGDCVWVAARAAHVPPSRVRVIAALPNPAFTVGWLRPTIVIASELAARLAPAELTAVLAHEGAHLRRRDPLRLSLLRFVACVLFWIPALRRLTDDVSDEAEIIADDAAAGSDPLMLASAILNVATWGTPAEPVAGRIADGGSVAVGVGFMMRDILERRVQRLAGEATPPGTHVTRRSLVLAIAALLLVWTSGLAVAHPLPAQSAIEAIATPRATARHQGDATTARAAMPMTMRPGSTCMSMSGPAILHIFCASLWIGRFHERCPHARS